MRKLFIAIAITAAIGVTVPTIAQQKVPVQFARGASSTTLKGTIKGEQYRDYLVNAREGQTMSVTLTNPDNRAYFNVLAPGSTGEAVFIGSTEGNRFRGSVPGTGNTTIRVYQMRATQRRGEVANYSLAIGVSGAATSRSNDAKVPGTAYNATSEVRCGRNADVLTSRCQAGVKRNANGTATVELRTPQDGRRNIQFRGTTVTSTDGGVPFSTKRYGDVTIVTVGDFEVYEIFDALVVGG